MPRQKTEGSAGVRPTAKAAAACETSTRIGLRLGYLPVPNDHGECQRSN